MAIYIISGLLLVLMFVVGMIGGIKKKTTLLIYFAIVNIAMFVFGLIQIGITIYALKKCNDDGKNSSPFAWVCNINGNTSDWKYYAPTASILLINLLGSIFACVLKGMINADSGESDTKNNFY